jgi:hypothetical protein
MNPKRKADLQRKLSLRSVPKPPADLLDRIKTDIPEYLRPEADRLRMRRSVMFNIRVAAALLILISAVTATLFLIEPQNQLSEIAMTTAPLPRVAADQRAAATDELRIEITESAPAAPVMQIADASPAGSPAAVTTVPMEPRRRDERKKEEREAETGVEGSVVGGVAGGMVGGVIGGVASTIASAEAMQDLAPPPAPPVAAPEPGQRPVSVTAEAPAAPQQRAAASSFSVSPLMREAHASELDLGPRATVFGISVDPNAFQRIKDTLEDNQRPAASSVNVEAIINYFAGGPAKKVRRGVKLEVEGSPSPLGAITRGGFLRFSIDTGEGQLPVASNAKLEIDLNGKVVENATPVGDAAAASPESALLPGLSVTGLYELSLKPNLRASDRVATIRLSYDDVADGKRKTLEKSVYARDFGKLWMRASRRHRLASLGAVWGQSLKSTSPAPEVARRAEELATQAPKDARAQELATAANASSKLSGF